jgi:hypothetical protein
MYFILMYKLNIKLLLKYQHNFQKEIKQKFLRADTVHWMNMAISSILIVSKK